MKGIHSIVHPGPARMPRTMRTRGLFCFILMAGFFLPVPERTQAEGKSCLWKIQSQKNAVYLLGSVHFLKEDSYPLAGAIERAFDDSQELVLEVDFGALDPARSQRVMLEKGLYENGKTLEGSLSKETYASVQKTMREWGMDIRALNRFEPWFVALTVMNLRLQKLGYDPNRGVDKYFFDKARTSRKEVLGLETFEFQIDLFDELPADTQESMLLQTLSDLEVMETELHRVVRSWVSGDVEVLDSLLLGSFKEYPAVYQGLILKRNQKWLPSFERFLAQDKNIMLVVGAGHLVGEDGIIAVLRKKGYVVEQL
jgi:uncharacterized protein YbaP (TraB family)